MGVPIAYGHAFAGFLLLSSFGFLAVGFDVLTWVDSWLQNPALQKPRIFFAVYVAPLSLGCVSFFKTPYWWAFMFGPYFLGIFGMIFAQTVISFAENNTRNQQPGND